MLDMKGGFIKNLPKIYGLYTGGFRSIHYNNGYC